MKNVDFKRLFSTVALFSALCWSIPLHSQPTIELVESVPVETDLGSPHTKSTGQIWLEMIDSAHETIDMEIFYLSHQPDKPLTPVINALKSAADRGVAIRILADAKMARTYPQTLDSLDLHPDISVRRIDYFNNLGGVMHAKYFIVDGEQLFLGSQNMDWRALEQIHELGVRIRNRKLSQLLEKIFELDWKLAFSSAPSMLPSLESETVINRNRPLAMAIRPGDTVSVYPAFSPNPVTFTSLERDESEIIRLIDAAQQYIEIQLLSYKPVSDKFFYEKIDNALRDAAVRGVKVKMIVSDWNTRYPDIQFLKSLQVIPNIDIRISSLPEWSGGFIPYARVEHCKYMVVDSEYLWIGTGNWGWSYFHNSRNISLIFRNHGLNRQVHEIFNISWTSPYCRDIDISRRYEPPRISGGESP